jgi:hypothetical protein
VLGRRDTKAKASDERPVPKYLNQAIAIYLTCARPILLGQPEFVIGEEEEARPDRLWTSSPAVSGSHRTESLSVTLVSR